MSATIAMLVYFLYLVTFSPYSKQFVAGPFYSFSDCQAAKGYSYVPGGSYECDPVYRPGLRL